MQLGVLAGVTAVEYGDHYPAGIAAYHLGLLGAEVTLVEPSEGCELRRLAERRPSALFAFAGRGRHPGQPATPPDILLLPAYPDPALSQALDRSRKDPAWARTLFVDFREADGTQLTELTAQAECGITAFLGHADAPPHRIGFEMVGHSAGMLAVQAIIAALLARGDGPGQSIRVPMSRAAAAILNNVTTASIAPNQPTHFSQGWAHDPSTGIRAADGAFEILFYGPGSATTWPRFCEALGAPALGSDPRFDSYPKRLDHPAELARALEPHTLPRPRAELIALVRQCGGMAMPKHGVAEAAAWEQTRANAMVSPITGLPTGPWTLEGQRPEAS